MKLIETKCPSCGAELEIDFEQRKAVCPYCGSSMMIEQRLANTAVPVMDKKQAKTKAKEEKKKAKLIAKIEKGKKR